MQSHTILLCLYVADPASFPASNSLGTLFTSEKRLCNKQILQSSYYHLIDVIIIKIEFILQNYTGLL